MRNVGVHERKIVATKFAPRKASISKIAVPERVIFTDVLPKTPSGKIMRRLLKEIMATGEVGSDVTALEDATAVDKLKALVKAVG